MSFDHSRLNTCADNYTGARQLIRHVLSAEPEEKLAFNATLNPRWSLDGTHFDYEHQAAQGSYKRRVDVVNRQYVSVAECEPRTELTASGREVASPDGQLIVFERDHDLWLRSTDSKSAQARRLTEDGEADYAYGAAPNMVAAGQVLESLSALQVLWSPDSKKLLAVQLDMRRVDSLPVVHHVPTDGSLRPQLEQYKFPMPGDAHMPVYRLVSIDIDTGHIVQAQCPPICFTYLIPFFTDGRAWWASDNQTAYFVDMKRGAQKVEVLAFDTQMGTTRVLFEETSSTWLNLHPGNYHGPSLFMPLPDSNELIWYSERSGWAHLYLYDLTTGELKQNITRGEWVVVELLRFDTARRELWIQSGGRTPGRDPYYKDICRVNIDTGELTEIVASDHNYYAANEAVSIGLPEALHAVSPNFEYLVVTRTRADQVPETLLFDRNGDQLMVVETADVSRLPENWQWPEPVALKAADGDTDIYGLVFRPTHFSPDKSYPVIDCSFAYLSGTLVCKAFDSGHHYMYSAALAELGFIVVQIDGRGSPLRSRAFLDHGDGSLTSGSDLADHITGLKQLAERYPYMDLARVGAFGGWTTSAIAINALLQYPDFYSVGVTCAMPQSQLYMALCSEPFEGHPPRPSDFVQPEYLADKLQGKLLMVHGMLDILDMPAATFRMVEAFQKANKDFDLLLLPNQQHAGSRHPYVTRRILDFFVRHLLGEEPPRNFDLQVSAPRTQSTTKL